MYWSIVRACYRILPGWPILKVHHSRLSSTPVFFRQMKTSNTEDLIDLTPFPIIYQPETIILHSLFKKHGFDLRIAGGAVRDMLLGISPHDIDFATNATPAEMNEMFLKENVRTLNRNGEAHGTVTVRICDKENFEITTLRIDVEPDGRHSKIVFTNDWKLDAARRDLTVNSMFIGLDWDTLPEHLIQAALSANAADNSHDLANKNDAQLFCPESNDSKVYGRIWDYFDGRADLAARRIRFVGDPASRIKEDYLRILRYFRFHGRLVMQSEFSQEDYENLKVISSNAEGLSRIAGERCWMELKKILLYPTTPLLLKEMNNAGVFPYLGLPKAPDFSRIDSLWKLGILSRSPNPATCLAALLSSVEEVEKLNARLRLSNTELEILLYIITKRDICARLEPEQEFAFYKRELCLSSEAPNKMKPLIGEMLRYLIRDPSLIDQWSKWEPPKFPVSGHQLMDKWNISNKIMRPIILALRTQWVDSDFRLQPDDLLTESNRKHVMSEVSSGKFAESKPKRIRRKF